jgi:hypothetical protein
LRILYPQIYNHNEDNDYIHQLNTLYDIVISPLSNHYCVFFNYRWVNILYNHNIFYSFSWIFFIWYNYFKIHPCFIMHDISKIYSFFLLSYIPLYGYNTICLCNHIDEHLDLLIASVTNKARASIYVWYKDCPFMSLYRHTFSYPLAV